MRLEQDHAALAALGTWLPDLDHQAALALTGRAAEERAVQAGVRLKSRPVALANRVVHATVVDRDSQARAVSVGRGCDGELACRCSCAAFGAAPPCEHVAALLLALAGSPALRRQLLDAPTPAGAPGLRAMAIVREAGVDPDALRRRRPPGLLEATFSGWRRRGEMRPLGQTAFFVRVEPHDPDGPDSSAALRVRVQPSGDRRPFGPDDLESRRLPAAEWRLLEPLGRAPAPARDFVARGAAATLFLDRAAEAGAELRDEADGKPLRLLEGQLRPALRRRDARPGEIAAHPAIAARHAASSDERAKLARAWQRYQTQVGPISEARFLELAGIAPESSESCAAQPAGEPAAILEAVWVPAMPSGAAQGAPPELEAPVPFADGALFCGASSWAYLAPLRAFARVAPEVGPIALARLAAQPTVVVAPGDLARLPALLREHFRAEGVGLPRRQELGLPALPVPRIVLRVTGSVFSARAGLEANYPGARFVLTPESCADPDDPSRHGELERAALDLLQGTALERAAATRHGAEAREYTAEGNRAIAFWTRDLPRLVAAASSGAAIDEVVAPPGLRQLAVRATVRSSLSARAAGPGMIEVALGFAAEGIPADVDEIRQALAAKRRWVRLTDGSVAELSESVAALAAATHDALRRSTTVELPRHAVGEVEAWRQLADTADFDERLADWTERLRSLPSTGPGPIAGLAAELRGYQKVGVAWLQLLADLGVGGILADDMGLGKTVQTLALLAWRRARDGHAPSLVVAPTSVALNWIREAERFVPGLRPLLLHGVGRHERYDQVASSDIVVTTYALLRRDVARLRDIAFRYVILDEAQQIKNHAAATTAAAKSLRAEARLALTGTPVENRLLELWSILDFVNPGMLGSWRSFARHYERPVLEALAEAGSAGSEDQRDEAAGLRARIRPFVLRRTKADVQSDLPPRIESEVVVELTPAQRRAYAALAAAIRADLEPKLSRDGLDRHRMLVLTALLRLRQLACDPRLVDPRHRPEDSAKLLAFRELVAEVIASGRRALVFSQFVELLALLRQDLDARGIAYAYLDGRTRDRQAVLEAFTAGTMPLFLISLRAGGTGINLAAADVVIHLDPWWNPAVEDQATDRAHRIGQVRTVSVYRIVAAGTIEEAISRLKESKRALASAVIEDRPPEALRLSESDLDELLSFTG